MPKEEKKSLLTRIVERKPPLYWWALLNVSVICAAVMSWLYFVPTFNYPEVPEHYERILKLGRTPILPAFNADQAPRGNTLNSEEIHQMFTSSELDDEDLYQLNTTLLRNYIQGIKLEKFNYYIRGKYKVTKARQLTKTDMFRSGIVVQAQSVRQVGTNQKLVPFLVEIEYLLPNVSPSQLDYFKPGKVFDIYQVPHFCSVLHVQRNTGADGETVVYLTVVPLVADPPLTLDNGQRLNPRAPERIYPEKSLPIFQ